MNFKELISIQEKLDIYIFENTKLSRKETRDRRFFALKTEICEFANEIGFFKYWKQNHVIKREKLLEEATDCLHFILSLFLDYNEMFRKKGKIHFDEICNKFEDLNNIKPRKENPIILFHKILRKNFDILAYPHLVGTFFNILVQQNITKEELVDAYMRKNKINYERQVSGY